jgi:hypothetical protein
MILAPLTEGRFAAPINPLAFTYYIYETSDPAASGKKSWGKTNLSPFMITLENADAGGGMFFPTASRANP